MKKLLLAVTATALLATGGAFAKTAGEGLDDTWIHTKVKATLIDHGHAGINIEVYRGVVQLAGFVDTEAQRAEAEKAAAEIKHVKQVSNKLFLQPEERTAGRTLDDGVIGTSVKTALTKGDFMRGFDTNVEVRSGVVLLSGFAGSQEQIDRAIEIAEGIEGVEKVLNGMDLKPAA